MISLKRAMRNYREAKDRHDRVYSIQQRLFARAHKFNKALGWGGDGPDYWKAIKLASSAMDRADAHEAVNYWSGIVAGLSKSPERMKAAKKALSAFIAAGGGSFWSKDIADMKADIEMWSEQYARTISRPAAPSASPVREPGSCAHG